MLCCFFSCYSVLHVSASSTKPSSGSMRHSKKAHPVQYISYNMQLRSQLYRDMHKVGAEIDKNRTCEVIKTCHVLQRSYNLNYKKPSGVLAK
jgi:hypothetical protein